MEFLPHFRPEQPRYVPGDNQPIDSPNYRNGASVSGMRLPGTINTFQRRAFKRNRDKQSTGHHNGSYSDSMNTLCSS